MNRIHERNQTLERQVLGWVILEKKWLIGLSLDYFQGDEYNLAKELHQQWVNDGTIDSEALLSRFETLLIEIGGLSVTGSKSALRGLKDAYTWRELSRVSLEAENAKTAEEARLALQEVAFRVSVGEESQYDHHGSIDDLMETVKRGLEDRKELLGYSTGIKSLDMYTNGLERGKLYVIGALKKTGKSRFAAYLAIKCAEQGAKVSFESLEMNAIQLNALGLAYYSGVNSRVLGKWMPDHEAKSVYDSAVKAKALNWSISTDMDIEDIKTRAIYEQPDVLIVDYIQKIRCSAYQGRAQQIERISQELADLAHHRNMCVIALSQLSGYVEKMDPDEIPNLSHYKESQGIGEALDCAISLHNPNRHEKCYSEAGGYIIQDFGVRTEQRHDVSGNTFQIIGDMRNCRFSEKTG